MPNQFTGTTFSGVYKDDYRDSDGYHKVLFNSGRYLQGRELNQLQTILQKQITRMANNIFQDGAAVTPKSSGAGTDIVDYVIVESLNLTSGLTASDFIGKTFYGISKTGTSGLKFQVSYVVDASGSDYPTLYGKYVSSEQSSFSTDVQTSTPVFSEAEDLTEVNDNLPALVVRTQPNGSAITSTGKGVLFSMQSAEFYVQGHFVYAPKQTIVIGKYVDEVDAEVGFLVVQDIVTTADTDELYDNQGSRPNLSSPGADRYRIQMFLSTREQVADAEDFVTFTSVRASKIVQIKGGTDNFNQVEKRMAKRHSDTHGNFIVNDFDVQFFEGDDSADMVYEIPANQFGSTPIAYLDGYRLEHQVPVQFNSAKPKSFTSISNQTLQTGYKNYVSFAGEDQAAKDNSLGSLGQFTNGLATQKKLNLINTGGDIIGSARMKSIVNRNTADSDSYRVHLYDVKMDGSNNFRDTRTIRAHDAVSGGIVPVLEDSNLYLTDPTVNTSLFEIPGGRVKEIIPTEVTVQRYLGINAIGNEITITCGSDEDLINEGQWLFINQATNSVDVIPTGNISITGKTATVTTSGINGNTYRVFFLVQKNAPAVRSKIYREDYFTATRTFDSSGEHFAFTSLYDGVELLEAKDSANGSEDYGNALVFDGGARDNYYGPTVLRPDGISSSVDTVYCKVGYFEHGTSGDYFSVNSYQLDSDFFSYGDIPSYTPKSTGEVLELHNCLDFRPTLDPLSDTSNSSQRFEMPLDGSNINYNVDFYNNRIDHIAVTYDENLKALVVVNSGEEALQPTAPSEKVNEMVLFDVLMRGNTKGVTDIGFNRRTYRSYKMTDINEISKRVSQLEETVSLSTLENEASNLVELNSSGEIRSKTGFFVDDFSKGVAFTASTIENEFIDDASFATSSLDEGNFTMHSKLAQENVGFVLDKDGITQSSRRPVTAENTKVAGDNVMLDYVSVLDPTMKQEMISWKGPGADYEESGYYNVNPFNVFMGEGVLRLNPARDIWFDNRRLPDKQTNAELIFRRVGEPVIPRTTTFSRTSSRTINSGGQWSTGWSGTWFRQRRVTTTNTSVVRVTQRVRNELVSDTSATTVVGDKRVAILSVPFMRQRRVYAMAEGLRPNTRYWAFMDGVAMQQWTKVRTKAAWQQDIDNGQHRKEYSPSNVNIVRHPFWDGAASQKLITDERGELYFELWIPNNAAVPVPKSSRFNSVKEWEKWQKNSRKYAKEYGSVKSVNALNASGWKFRCGTLPVKLLDVSIDKEGNALSMARSTYTAQGSVNVRQRELKTTRTIAFRSTLVERSDVISTSTTNTVNWGMWQPRDPLAQTFTVDGGSGVPGVFVTEIDIFLHKTPITSNKGGTDLAIPLQLQIRSVDNGVPDRDAISEQHSVFISADSAYDATFASGYDLDRGSKVRERPVKMKFKEPVYLRSGDEYAIVLLAETDNYEAYVASTYDLSLGSTGRRINKQPSKGSLFLSQNGSTWTPKQNQDLTYRIYTAKFKQSGGANFYSNPLEKYMHNYGTSLSVDSDNPTRFRVEHLNHGLGVGDLVSMEGLPSGTYKGITSSVISDASNEVVDPDVNGYYVALSSGSFDSSGSFGSSAIETNRAMPLDNATLLFQDMQFERCGIKYSGSFVSGVNHSQISSTGVSDPRFDIDNQTTSLENGGTHYFETPKYVGNAEQEYSEIANLNDSAPSVIIGAELFSEQISSFGGSLAVSAAGNGYVSDVSPVIDTQSLGMIVMNNVIDNQVDSAGETATLVKNKPSNFVAETHPTLGTSPSKHITKVVQLQQAASGLKVLCDMYVPPSAEFDLYYRTGAEADENLYQKDWVLVTPQNDPAKSVWVNNEDDLTFSEYRYLIGGENGDLPDFVSFQVKLVLKSVNTCQSPVIESIRAIALI